VLRIFCLAMLLLASAGMARSDGPGVVGPDRVAEVVAADQVDELLAKTGAELLAAASRANVGKPSVGLKKLPVVASDFRAVLKSTAAKIVQPAKSCAVTLLRKVHPRGAR